MRAEGVQGVSQISNVIERRYRNGFVTPDPRQARHAVRTLRASLGQLEVSDDVRTRAGWALEQIEVELQLPDPDRGVITGRLESFVELLAEAGTLGSAGASLIRPIRAIATWLGPIAAPLLGRLAS